MFNKYKINKKINVNSSNYFRNRLEVIIDETWKDYNPISLNYVIKGFYLIYLFPEEDFCLFNELPQEKLIIVYLTIIELKVIFI